MLAAASGTPGAPRLEAAGPDGLRPAADLTRHAPWGPGRRRPCSGPAASAGSPRCWSWTCAMPTAASAW
ncbi:hypothetical protein HBB16_04835 [Pseudonocardia sp. MCCB 268]|nr:hypothetical protein [Pseudonocardia cytotoxica]